MLEKLEELSARLSDKEYALRLMSQKQMSHGEERRLSGKVEGVSLARSFVDELIREVKQERGLA